MGNSSIWDANDLKPKVIGLLASVKYCKPDHHLGRPFLTAYQLAVLFKKRYPEHFESIGLPVGGKGSEVGQSLSGYLARQLSARIDSCELSDQIEGGFLSNCGLKLVQFDDDGATVTSVHDRRHLRPVDVSPARSGRAGAASTGRGGAALGMWDTGPPPDASRHRLIQAPTAGPRWDVAPARCHLEVRRAPLHGPRSGTDGPQMAEERVKTR